MVVSKGRKKKTRVNSRAKDVHHILWQRRHWDGGWNKILRNHDYFKVLIPRDTLHKRIHEFVGDIPCPDGKHCKLAYEEVERRLDEGTINYYDHLEKRIDLLVELWSEDCPETVKALLKQRDVVSHFYGN